MDHSFLYFISLHSKEEKFNTLQSIGVTAGGIERILPKMDGLTIRICNIDPRAASILKQDALSLGGDFAIPDSVSRFDPSPVDGLLMGSRKIFNYLVRGLENQPYGLKGVGKKISCLFESMESPQSLVVKGKDILQNKPFLLMGILNVTPNSFSDGGRYLKPENAISCAYKLIEEGADIIDIGGESTKPGSKPVDEKEETNRILPVISELKKKRKIIISVDTRKSKIAETALNEGADIINDVSGGRYDPEILDVASRHKCPLILMHSRDNPEIMQKDPFYEDAVKEVFIELSERRDSAVSAGIDPVNILIDPGIGFSKRYEDNLILINHLDSLRPLGSAVVVGTSRKSFISKALDEPDTEKRLEGSLASIVIALERGARIFRVHDVIASKKALIIASEIILAKNCH